MNRLDELAEGIAVLRPVRRDAILFSLLSAARSGEVKRARVEDLDFEGRSLLLRKTKNGRDHLLHLAAQAAEVALRAALLSRNGLLLEGCSDLRVRSQPDWFPHAARKLWACSAVAAGVHPPAIKRLGNWSSTDVVEKHYGSNLSADVLQLEAQRVTDRIVSRMSPRSRAILGLRVVGSVPMAVVEGGLGRLENARTA